MEEYFAGLSIGRRSTAYIAVYIESKVEPDLLYTKAYLRRCFIEQKLSTFLEVPKDASALVILSGGAAIVTSFQLPNNLNFNWAWLGIVAVDLVKTCINSFLRGLSVFVESMNFSKGQLHPYEMHSFYRFSNRRLLLRRVVRWLPAGHSKDEDANEKPK